MVLGESQATWLILNVRPAATATGLRVGLQPEQESGCPGECVKTQAAGPRPIISDSVYVGEG